MKTTAEMTFDELTSYWMGRFIVAIGEGNLRAAVAGMLQSTMTDAYQRGAREAKKRK